MFKLQSLRDTPERGIILMLLARYRNLNIGFKEIISPIINIATITEGLLLAPIYAFYEW